MAEFYTNVLKNRGMICVRGYDAAGQRFLQRRRFQPTLYVPAPPNTNTKLHTISGDPVTEMKFSSSSNMWKYVNQYSDVQGFDFYGLEDSVYQYIYQTYNNVRANHSLIQTCILDIEVDTEDGYPDINSANRKITAITMLYKDVTFVLGYGEYTPPNSKIKYIKCATEEILLERFLKIWTSESYCPDVVSGWNIEFFDIPYLVNRCRRLFGDDMPKQMSPLGVLSERTIEIFGKPNTVFYPAGIAILDYLSMYKKFVAVQEPQETYRLDHIAEVELGERKLDYSEFGHLHVLAAKDHQKFIEYNIRDCELVSRIDAKRNLFELIYTISYMAGVNFADALGSVRLWDVMIHKYLMDRNVVIPKKTKNQFVRKPVGAYVKQPNPGLYGWTMSFDLTSLYPHLIMQYNIGPDTFAGMLGDDFDSEELIAGKHKKYDPHLAKNNLCMAANSATFRKDKTSFLSQLMSDMFAERKKYKKDMIDAEARQAQGIAGLEDEIARLDVMQYSLKVLLNSAYGALANQYFRWYDINYAEAITKSGQLSIKWIAFYLNLAMNRWCNTEDIDYVIAIDTDSVYLNVDPIAKETGADSEHGIATYLNAFAIKKIQPFIDTMFEKLAVRMHADRNMMFMKREVIAKSSVFVAKKRYALDMYHKEDVIYQKPKMKIMGFESVRSSTPASCRTAIEETIRRMLQENEQSVHDFVKKFRAEYDSLPFEDIAKNTSVNGLEKYGDKTTIYKSATPMHVRAALLYNKYLQDNKLTKTHEPIFEGEKIKYCYLNLPNPIKENVIAVPSILDKKLGLHEYLDRDTQFKKTFEEPIQAILGVCGWTSRPINRVTSLWE